MYLPIHAARQLAPAISANLRLRVSGLDGSTLRVTGAQSTPLGVFGTLIWPVPVAQGLYFLDIRVSDSYGALTTQQVPVYVMSSGIPPIEFDSLSAQFVSAGQTITIPLGAFAINSASQLEILSVSGLPGASLQSVTDPKNLGSRVAANMTWTAPAAPGVFWCSVAVMDDWSGNFVTAVFPVLVSSSAVNNQSPIIVPMDIEQAIAGSTFSLPIQATRQVTPASNDNLTLEVSGLDGSALKITGAQPTPLSVSGTLTWQVPDTPGFYFLEIQVSDANSAWTTQEVPVYVGENSLLPLSLTFNSLPAQSVAAGATLNVPLKVYSSYLSSQLEILSVSGLPGATLQPFVNGSSLQEDLTWNAPSARGQFYCSVFVLDNVSGNYMTEIFPVTVSPSIKNLGSSGPKGTNDSAT